MPSRPQRRLQGQARRKFKAISEAYECLKDPQKRAAYDRFGHAAFQNGGGGGGSAAAPGLRRLLRHLRDDLRRVHGPRGAARQRRARRRPALRHGDRASRRRSTASSKTISIEALARCEPLRRLGRRRPGTRRARCATCGGRGKVRAQQGFFVVERSCPTCQGSGEVIADPCRACRGEGRALEVAQARASTFPPGVDDGTRIRVAGEGEAGVRGAPSGDLYIFVHLKRHALFQREGTTLFARAPISFTTAALGGTIDDPGHRRQAHRDQDSRRHPVGRSSCASAARA